MLIPKVQLVAVLLEPGERAYSWYQHQKAHNVDAATKYSFNQILNSGEGNKPAYELRQVSLNFCFVAGIFLCTFLVNFFRNIFLNFFWEYSYELIW